MNTDLNSLLNGSSTGTSIPSFSLPAGFTTLFTIFTITTSIASIVILIFYVLNAVTTYRAHRANIEMRDILREMNERDKARSAPVASPKLPAAPQEDPTTNTPPSGM